MTYNNENFAEYLKLINNCNPNDPLISETILGKFLDRIPLSYISLSMLTESTQALDVEQLIPTENGLARDYRGLAEVMGFSTIEIKTKFEHLQFDRTKRLINLFKSKNLTNTATEQNTNRDFIKDYVSITDLLKMIERIERFDVIDDLLPTLIEIARQQQQHGVIEKHTVSGDDVELYNTRNNHDSHTNVLDKNFLNQLTFDDTPEITISYDAFVCYAPEDLHYAQELISLLEDNGKRVATADDLLPGHFEHDALIRLINSRCRNFIAILTNNTAHSDECILQTKFASGKLTMGRFLPVLFETTDCLPSVMQILTKIDLTSADPIRRDWQIKKLVKSLTHSSTITNFQIQHQNRSNNMLKVQQTNIIPAIAFGDTNYQSSSVSSNDRNPIVELLHSEQVSSNIPSSHNLSSSDSADASSSLSQTSGNGNLSPAPNPDTGTEPINTSGRFKLFSFKSFRKSFMGATYSSASSNSSQAYLIPSSDNASELSLKSQVASSSLDGK